MGLYLEIVLKRFLEMISQRSTLSLRRLSSSLTDAKVASVSSRISWHVISSLRLWPTSPSSNTLPDSTPEGIRKLVNNCYKCVIIE